MRHHPCPEPDCGILAENLRDHLVGFHARTEAEADGIVREQRAAEAVLALQAQAGDRCADFTLDTFPAHDNAGSDALALGRKWLAGETAPSLFVWGPPGTGKTGLAYALAREKVTVYRTSVRFVNVRELLAQLRLEIADGNTPNLGVRLAADLIVLDDLGAERPTAWAIETLATIVEQLYRRGAGAIIATTNYSPSDLGRRLSTKEDPVAGQRIVSRLLEDATTLHLQRHDLRVAGADPEPRAVRR